MLGYRDYLAELLQPLGIYDLENGVGAAELEAVGEKMDEVFSELELLERELLPVTAESYGLLSYEGLFPYRAAYITSEDRNRAVMALMRIRNGCFTVEQLGDTLKGCGINAIAEESDKALTVEVSFPDNWGIPEGIDELKERVESILPCHLAVEYVYLYAKWQEIMEIAGTWAEIEALCSSWKELEILRG